MKELYCKLCGYRGGAEERTCPDCGAPLFEALDELVETAAPEAQEVNIKKKRRGWPGGARSALAAGFLAVCLVLQGVGLWWLHRPVDPPWSLVSGNRLVTAQGIWNFEANVWMGDSGGNAGACRVLTTWLNRVDGSSAVPENWLYDGQSVEKQDWLAAILSGDGQVLFYETALDDGRMAITRRDLRSGRETEIARDRGLSFAGSSDYAGTALCYFSGLDNTAQDQLLGVKAQLWQMGRGSREVDEPPVYLGRQGDNYLGFVPAEDDGYGYQMIVSWNGGERRSPVDYDVVVDRELTAALYRGQDGSWRYEDQEGRSRVLEGLPSFASLSALQPAGTAGDAYAYLPPRLTDQVYQAGGELFYLDEELEVTMLTPGGTFDHPVLTADGRSLYCTFRPQARNAQLWRLDRQGGEWERSVVCEEKVHSYVVSPDGQTLCARCWAGKDLVWKVLVEDGSWQTLDKVWSRAREADLLPMNGGGCWYLGESTSLHKELWYRAPSGETTPKLAYTAPYSSTLYPTDAQAEVVLSGLADEELYEVEELEFLDPGRGDQAVLRVSYDGPGLSKVKRVSGVYAPPTDPADYWLLESDGTMTKLEAMEL